MTLPILEILLSALGVYAVSRVVQSISRRLRTTPLQGPPSPGFFLGASKQVHPRDATFAGQIYEEWVARYGAAFNIAGPLGSTRLVLYDPKAIAHVYARDTYGYTQRQASKDALVRIIGRGLLWADGDSHKRQRKTLSPGFSNAAIRELTSVFFDSAYKVKTAWDNLLESRSSGECVIEVQQWMNRISLDSIGLAGFSHDFGTLRGETSAVGKIFGSLAETGGSSLSRLIFFLRPIIPFIANIPTKRGAKIQELNQTMGKIADELLERHRKQNAAGEEEASDKSIIGLLFKAESAESSLNLSAEEVSAEMKILIVAGYETTSISMTWALIELARHPQVQDRLREELLSEFGAGDPTWDQLTHGLPYLDAVVHEILRIHAPVSEGNRVAMEDDIIPLTSPIRTANGTTIDRITIAKGTDITVPIRALNMSPMLWGPDAREFRPERWLDSENGNISSLGAHEVSGYRHLLTFVDGPRICLGKGFAVAEFKAVVSVLVRNYMFELPDGVDTKLASHVSLLPRPKVVEEDGPRVSMKIRKVE